jgi:uncharacterized protein with PIN domain
VPVAWFRFYAELNDFLPASDRGKPLKRHFDVIGPVKDLIEGFGVPHTEIDLILINGESAAFSQAVHDGDRVSVYPVFESLDISALSRVRPGPRPALRFVLDVHLGRLAAYLRMAGFDTLYSSTASDSTLVDAVVQQNRVLLTRDRYLLMRSAVEMGYCVRSADPKQQFLEVVRRFHLVDDMRPFTRCMKCNSLLAPVGRDSVLGRLPPRVREKEEFRVCSGCGAVYWEGTHYSRMSKLLEWVKANAGFRKEDRSRTFE